MAAHENLSGQFKHLGGKGSNSDSYDYVKVEDEPVWSDREQDWKHEPTARSHLSMTVSHNPGTQAFVSPREGGGVRWGGNSSLPHEFEAAEDDLNTPGPGGQGKLFGMHTTPATSTVDYMTGTKAGSRHAMTMLGIAHNRNIAERGRGLVPDESLSPHSHRLAQHLAEKTGDPSVAPVLSEPNNAMTFNDTPGKYYLNDWADVVHPDEVRQGRAHIRGVIKGTRSLDPRGHAPLPPPAGERRQGPVNPDQFTLF